MNGNVGVQGQTDQNAEELSAAQYTVGPPAKKVGVAREDADLRRVAVFVAHGMGQQIPFETLDAIADALRKADIEKGHNNPKPASVTVKADDKWLQRVELRLKSGAEAVEAHVYEGYWAPLTEGRITTRNVMSFLAGGGSNGLKIARRKFRRYVFDKYQPFPTPFRTILFLLIALGSVGALVALNSTIALVAAGRALLNQRPDWLTDGLLADLTTTFNGVVTAMALLGISLLLARLMRRFGVPQLVRSIWGWLTLPFFTLTVFVIILAGVSTILLFYAHVRGGIAEAAEVWPLIIPGETIPRFNARFDYWALRLVLVGAGLRLLWVLGQMLVGFVRDILGRHGRWLTILITIVFALLVMALVWLVNGFLQILQTTGGEGFKTLQRGVAWPLLFIASAYIRRVLMQYVGDVAIYVMPYKLDAFNDLRKEIKDAVYKVAHAVYALPRSGQNRLEYDKVIVLGHSLGSVIVYDALNRLIHEDRETRNLDVVNRTPLFLTFGSPLDKTAFIFAAQGHGTTEARESLAASVQPLIQDYKFRPAQWINIYSPWDIISGNLDLYDLPDVDHPKAVKNKADPDATTLLMAHTEYWKGDLLVRTLYEAL